jgi:hypothetical protein
MMIVESTMQLGIFDMDRVAVFTGSKPSRLREYGAVTSRIATGVKPQEALTYIHSLTQPPLTSHDPLYWWKREEYVARVARTYI